MEADVQAYIKSCPECEVSESRTEAPGHLQPMPMPSLAEQRATVALDIIGPWPDTRRGCNGILAVPDLLAKRPHVEPTRTDATAEQQGDITKFAGQFWGELWNRIGVEHRMTTPFHHQANGQVERSNRTVEEALRHWVSAKHDDWDTLLGVVEFAINNAVQQSSGDTPFISTRGETRERASYHRT